MVNSTIHYVDSTIHYYPTNVSIPISSKNPSLITHMTYQPLVARLTLILINHEARVHSISHFDRAIPSKSARRIR